MEQLISPKLVARAIGVSESSVKRWCDRGLLQMVRTAGGHRRMKLDAVIEFIRQTGQTLVEPELLGLPSCGSSLERTLERALPILVSALAAGEERIARQLVLEMYLGGQGVQRICDEMLTKCLHQIGSMWEHSQLEIYQERRACEILLRILHEVRKLLPPLSPDAPFALGGTVSGDPYQLPTIMVELCLREAGWRAESFGTNLPLATMAAAVQQSSPRLCWLSVSYLADLEAFLRDFKEFAQITREQGTVLLIGGQALTQEVRRELDYAAYCDSFRHVVQLAESLRSSLTRMPAAVPLTVPTV